MTRTNTSNNTPTADAVHNDAPQTPGSMLPFSTMTVQHLLNGGINMTEVNLTGLPGDAVPVQSPYVSENRCNRGDRPGVLDGQPMPQGDPASAPTFNGELVDMVEHADGDTEGKRMGTRIGMATVPPSSMPGTTDGITRKPENITPPPQHLLTMATSGVIATDGWSGSAKGKCHADGVCYQRPPSYRPAPSSQIFMNLASSQAASAGGDRAGTRASLQRPIQRSLPSMQQPANSGQSGGSPPSTSNVHIDSGNPSTPSNVETNVDDGSRHRQRQRVGRDEEVEEPQNGQMALDEESDNDDGDFDGLNSASSSLRAQQNFDQHPAAMYMGSFPPYTNVTDPNYWPGTWMSPHQFTDLSNPMVQRAYMGVAMFNSQPPSPLFSPTLSLAGVQQITASTPRMTPMSLQGPVQHQNGGQGSSDSNTNPFPVAQPLGDALLFPPLPPPIAYTPVPGPGGFPVLQGLSWDSFFINSDPMVAESWRNTMDMDRNTIFICFYDQGYPVNNGYEQANTLSNLLPRLAREHLPNMEVGTPVAMNLEGHDAGSNPNWYFIRGLTTTARNHLVRATEGVWSTEVVTIFVAPAFPRMTSFLFTLDGLSYLTSSQNKVERLVRNVWLASPDVLNFVHSNGSYLSTDPMVAVRTFTDSVRVRPFVIGNARHSGTRAVWGIYASPISQTPEIQNQLIETVASLSYGAPSGIGGRGRCIERGFPCTRCRGIDHPSGLCPYLEVQGWMGPGPLSTSLGPNTSMEGNSKQRSRGWHSLGGTRGTCYDNSRSHEGSRDRNDNNSNNDSRNERNSA
ncbi:hypothetical protein EV421DRAFT_1914120 [Armillaria borealis]|uniref:Uncharacterized protein n=1 Tax=Armillaria borealis TaxID=47425 RepID=A0AA39ITW0_9AGAR|nr:hypothetical protein EV421DRAFT_1914120 [Armillaria borealis]